MGPRTRALPSRTRSAAVSVTSQFIQGNTWGKGEARGAQLLLCPRSASGNDVGSSGKPEAAVLDEGLQPLVNVRYKCLDGRLGYRTPSRPIHVHLILDEVCRRREVRDLCFLNDDHVEEP